jgi:hypothetical protein
MCARERSPRLDLINNRDNEGWQSEEGRSRKLIRHLGKIKAMGDGDTRNKRLFGSDKPASVNLDGASFIYINAATLGMR